MKLVINLVKNVKENQSTNVQAVIVVHSLKLTNVSKIALKANMVMPKTILVMHVIHHALPVKVPQKKTV